MVETTVKQGERTTLPKEVLEALGVEPGDRVRFFISDGRVAIRPVRPMSRLFSTIRYDGPPVTLEQMDLGRAEGATEAHDRP